MQEDQDYEKTKREIEGKEQDLQNQLVADLLNRVDSQDKVIKQLVDIVSALKKTN